MIDYKEEKLIKAFWEDQLVQNYFSHLKELISLKSIFAQDVGLTEAANYLVQLFEEAGAETICDDSYKAPFVVATFTSPKPNAKTLIFYNHYDTVPADMDQKWTSDPFEVSIRDNYLYGRGVDDDKGHIISRLSAVKKYLAQNKELPLNIIFMMEGAEESASVDLEKYLNKHQKMLNKADVLIWEQGIINHKNQLEITGGNKGIVTFDLSVSSANIDIHSKFGGVIESAAWYLVQALNSLRSSSGEILVEGLYDDVLQPNERELEMVDQYGLENAATIQSLYGLDLPMLQSERLELLKSYYFKSSLTIEGFKSGYLGQGVKTIIPAEASAKMEIRLIPGQDPKNVLELVERQLEKNGFGKVEVTYTLGEKSYRSDLSHPEIQHVLSVLESEYSGGLSLLPTSPGTGPMHTVFEALEVPILSFGMGNPDSRDHAGDENVAIKDYYTHVILIEELIKSYE